MQGLTLRFVSDDKRSISLSESKYFCSEQSQIYRCVRGKPNSIPGYGAFYWSPAVQAVALFFLYQASTETKFDAFIEGEVGSLAASLDYAISKQPNWILDMFGVDQDGNANIRKIIKRANSERKRPGPVRLFMQCNYRNDFRISILLNNLPIKEQEVLLDLSRNLISQRLQDRQKLKKTAFNETKPLIITGRRPA